MRPAARKLPFCPSVAGELKPWENAGSSPFILTLSFGGRALWTPCDFISFFLRHQAAALSSQIICVFASSLSGEEDQRCGPTAPARGCRSGQRGGRPCGSGAGRQMAFKEHQLLDQWVEEG